MQIDGVPDSISREVYLALISSLGLEPDLLTSLSFGPKSIRAEMYALNTDGQCYVDGVGESLKAATHVITIPVLDDIETPA